MLFQSQSTRCFFWQRQPSILSIPLPTAAPLCVNAGGKKNDTTEDKSAKGNIDNQHSLFVLQCFNFLRFRFLSLGSSIIFAKKNHNSLHKIWLNQDRLPRFPIFRGAKFSKMFILGGVIGSFFSKKCFRAPTTATYLVLLFWQNVPNYVRIHHPTPFQRPCSEAID